MPRARSCASRIRRTGTIGLRRPSASNHQKISKSALELNIFEVDPGRHVLSRPYDLHEAQTSNVAPLTREGQCMLLVES